MPRMVWRLLYMNDGRKDFRNTGNVDGDHDLNCIKPVVASRIQDNEENHAQSKADHRQAQKQTTNRSSIDSSFWIQT
jgi:hypothetical protein